MSDHSTADLVLVDADVVTMNPSQPSATAVAIRDGAFLAVGDDPSVRALCGARTQVVNMRGACLLPGLTDGHAHPVHGLDVTAGDDLSGCRTVDELRATLATTPADRHGWVRGYGLDPNVFERGIPSADLVEDVLRGTPALLQMFDAHSALASHTALRAADITGPREFTQQARIVCDQAGRPTGHLLEDAAVALVDSVVPAESQAERTRRLRELLTHMAATGLTGAHVMDGEPDTLDLLETLEQSGDLPLRLRLAPWCQPETTVEARHDLLARQRRHGRRWSVDAVKFFLDGTIDGGTAWLETPDCYGESTRAFWTDPTAYTDAVRFFAEAGVQTATHAIGDAAVRHALDSIQQVDHGRARVRHRIEHVETLSSEQIARFAASDVVASMQPSHCTDFTRADHTDNWSTRLTPERADRGWPCADLRSGGATLVLGSDWPIAHYDPRHVLTAARLRRTAGEPGAVPNHPEQGLTAYQALEGYTTHAAYAAGQEHTTGRVAPGHRADITALATNPLRTSPTELPDTPVVLTMVGGHITHAATARCS